MATELLQTVEVANTLGEGVLWNGRRQTVWWTDIEGSALFEYDPVSETLETWRTPYRVGCFGFCEGHDELIVAFDCGIATYDVRRGVIQWLVEPGSLVEGIRFNDGKVDAMGRFWVGSMVEAPSAPKSSASLYCLDPDVGLVEHLREISISNGLCWSPDGAVMYHADSPRHSIMAYSFDAKRGTLSNPSKLAETPHGVYPDGSTVDAEGAVWNAQWGGASVVRYLPEGQVDHVIELSVSQPTCVAFGGADMGLMFITSARQGLTDVDLETQPEAGCMFVYKSDYHGLPANEFRMRRT